MHIPKQITGWLVPRGSTFNVNVAAAKCVKTPEESRSYNVQRRRRKHVVDLLVVVAEIEKFETGPPQRPKISSWAVFACRGFSASIFYRFYVGGMHFEMATDGLELEQQVDWYRLLIHDPFGCGGSDRDLRLFCLLVVLVGGRDGNNWFDCLGFMLAC